MFYQLQNGWHGLHEILKQYLPLLQKSLEYIEWDSPVASTMTDIKRQNPTNKHEENGLGADKSPCRYVSKSTETFPV